MEGMSPFSYGEAAKKDWDKVVAEKNDQLEEQAQLEKKENLKKFNEIQIGSIVAYKKNPETKVEFLPVIAKDEATMTITLDDNPETTAYKISTPNVTMDKIIDIDNSPVKEA